MVLGKNGAESAFIFLGFEICASTGTSVPEGWFCTSIQNQHEVNQCEVIRDLARVLHKCQTSERNIFEERSAPG